MPEHKIKMTVSIYFKAVRAPNSQIPSKMLSYVMNYYLNIKVHPPNLLVPLILLS